MQFPSPPGYTLCYSFNAFINRIDIQIMSGYMDWISQQWLPWSLGVWVIVDIFTAWTLFLDSVMLNEYLFVSFFGTFQSQFLFARSQAFAGISLALLGLMASPPRSCDRLDDDHMTAVVHRRWVGSLYPWSQFMACCPNLIWWLPSLFSLTKRLL